MLMILTDKFDYDVIKLKDGRIKVIKYDMYSNRDIILRECYSNEKDYIKHIVGKILHTKGRIQEGGILYAKIKTDIKGHWDVCRDTWYEVILETENEIRIVNNLLKAKNYLSCDFDFKYEEV